MHYFKIVLLSLLGFVFCSCCRSYVSIQEQWVDKEYLASSHVNTPDPETNCPPCGKNLLVEWNFPISVFRQQLCIILTARLYDNTTHICKYQILEKRGSITEFFSYKNLSKRLLTYKIEILNANCKLIENIENQFWTEKITEE